MWQLGLALLLLTGGAAFLRDRCTLGVASVLLANWAINTGYVWASNDPAPWGFFLAADYFSGVFAVAGLGLICRRFTVVSAVIALTYAAECVAHAAYGLSDHGQFAQDRYWWTTFYIAVGQIMIVFGWGAYDLARRHIGARRRMAPDASGLARSGHSSPVEP